MKDSSTLRRIDVLASKHIIPEFLHACFSCELEEGGEDIIIDEVLRVVEKDGNGGF